MNDSELEELKKEITKALMEEALDKHFRSAIGSATGPVAWRPALRLRP